MAITIDQLNTHLDHLCITHLDELIKNNSYYDRRRKTVEVRIKYERWWDNADVEYITSEYENAGWQEVELTIPRLIQDGDNDWDYYEEGKMILRM